MYEVRLESGVSSSSSSVERLNLYRNFEPLLVRAGAGAGKTTELVERIVALALEALTKGQPLPRIIATTFTRKATQEMRERILSFLLNLKKDEKLRLSQDQHRELMSWAQSYESLWVTTLDGLALKWVQQAGVFSVLISSEIDFLQEEGISKKRLSRKVVRKLLEQDVEFCEAYSLILEYGDLDDIIDWIGQVELKSLVHENFGPISSEQITQQKELMVAKLRSVTSRLLSVWEPHTPAQKKLHLWLKEIEQLSSFDSLIDWISEGPSLRALPKDYPEHCKELRTWIDQLKCPAWQTPFIQAHQKLIRAFELVRAKIVPKLLQEKFLNGQWEVHDFEAQLLRLIQNAPESISRISKEWDFWFIDEYQDISEYQEKWLDELVAKDRIYRVGDPQQSIYLFRGARSDLFIKREKELLSQGSPFYRQKLVNFRSRPELIDFANKVFQGFPGFAPMSSGRIVSTPTFSPVRGLEIAAMPGQADLIHLAYNQVANEVKRLIQFGIQPSKIAVLSPTRRPFLYLSQQFRQLGIPACFHGEARQKVSSLALDALRLLKFFALPKDQKNLFLLLSSQVFSVHKLRLAHWALKWKSSTASFPWEVEGWHDMGAFTDRLREGQQRVLREGLIQVWIQSLNELSFMEVSREIDPTGFSEAELMCLIGEIQSNSRKWIQPDSPLFLDLNEWLSEILDPGPQPAGRAEAVQVMTVHASKGLEFDHVVIAIAGDLKIRSESEKIYFSRSENGSLSYGFELKLAKKDWIPPFSKTAKKVFDKKYSLKTKSLKLPFFARTLEKKDLLGECVRSFYVAITRARDSLCLIWPEELVGLAKSTTSMSNESVLGDTVFDESVQTEAMLSGELTTNTEQSSKSISSGWEDLIPKLKSILGPNFQRTVLPEDTALVLKPKGSQQQKSAVEVLNCAPSRIKQASLKTGQSKAYLGSFSVSRLLTGYLKHKNKLTEIRLESLSNTIPPKNLTMDNPELPFLAREKGIKIHQELQGLAFFYGLTRAGYPPPSLVDERRAKEALRFWVGEHAHWLAGLMKEGFPEWGFTQVISAEIEEPFTLDLQGKIDLWALDFDGTLWVIDYKTGGSLDLETTFLQVRLYGWALLELERFWRSKLSKQLKDVEVRKICLTVLDLKALKRHIQEVRKAKEWDWGFTNQELIRAAVLEMSDSPWENTGIEYQL